MGTKIAWAEETWNAVTGCTPFSPGCQHCYAAAMAKRLKGMGQPNYANGFEVTLHPHMLDRPLRWRKPKHIFVGSMTDLFHQDVPDNFLGQVFDTMVRCPQHRFQLLTKRAKRLAEIAPRLPWPKHIWMGVTVETADYFYRLDCLRATPAAVKFVSIEPLLGPLDGFDPAGLDWVIVGGESGPGARPMDLDWVRPIRDKCVAGGVPLFLKQLGGFPNKRDHEQALLDGRLWKQMPCD